MIVLNKIIPFDVDGTLIGLGGPREISFFNPNHNIIETTKVYEPHVELIKLLKNDGYSVVVWSMSGAQYAANVVRALGLEDCVALVSDKPVEYFDDQKCGWEWMSVKKFIK